MYVVVEAEWSGEALRIMAGLTAGQLLHAQVAGYDEAGLPLVHLYLTLHPQVNSAICIYVDDRATLATLQVGSSSDPKGVGANPGRAPMDFLYENVCALFEKN